ncbi:hypothetical protein DSO57_1030390 [Entomophthora muscae]|uniref:Uncharacterized protein n=1 Tax=Entomophthora muscae TaxID=34485 RepID=A0ACC2ULI9_9FUNG|nr:hypothetical protein DSO57_1030390 [Entomophthora muscae]
MDYLQTYHLEIFPANQLTILEEFMNFVMCSNYFTFHGQVFTQRQGVAMGTPCAPSFANIYLQALERRLLLEVLANNPEAKPLSGQLQVRVHQKVLDCYLYLPYNLCHSCDVIKPWIKTEIIQYIRNSSCKLDFLDIRAKFAARLRARSYPPCFVKFAIHQEEYVN